MHNHRIASRIAVTVLLALTIAGKTGRSSAADEAQIGGSVNVLGVLSGDNLEAFLGAFAPFEEATGITIEYEGTFDLLAVLQTRLDGGNPPDIVSNPSAGQMQTLAADGELLALDDIVDVPPSSRTSRPPSSSSPRPATASTGSRGRRPWPDSSGTTRPSTTDRPAARSMSSPPGPTPRPPTDAPRSASDSSRVP